MKRIFDFIKEGKAYEWGLVAIAFSLSFYLEVTVAIILVTFILWLVQKNLLQNLKNAYKNRYFKLFTIFYLIHIVSFFISVNKNYAGSDLEIKLSLLIFPLFFFSHKNFSSKTTSRILKAFVFGCLFATILCFYFSLRNSINNPITSGEFNISIYSEFIGMPWWELIINSYSYFNYIHFSHFIHPSYFALYLTFAAFIVISSKKWFDYKSIGGKILNNVIVSFLVLCIFLLQSRAGLLGVFFFLIWSVFKSSLRTKQVILVFSVLLSLTFIILVNGRFEIMSNKLEKLTWTQIENSNERISIWEQTIKLISKKPIFGYGIGDAKDILVHSYQESGMELAFQKKLNVHNDFLEIGLKTGFVGLFSFLIILIIPLFFKIPNLSFYIFFILLIGIHFTFESMLERFAGVSFFSFFYSLITSIQSNVSPSSK